MLCWSKHSNAPRPDCTSAARVRARRYSCRRRKSTRSSKSTCVRPGACSGRSQRCFGSISSGRACFFSFAILPPRATILTRIVCMLVPADKLVSFTAACLEKLGLRAADARLVAETLVAANLRGVDSHGVVRLPHYATRLRNGTVKARPNISARKTGPSAAVVEGDAGMGQLVAARAMREAISLPRESGSGAVAARNSSHCGACAWFAEMAVKEGMIGV